MSNLSSRSTRAVLLPSDIMKASDGVVPESDAVEIAHQWNAVNSQGDRSYVTWQSDSVNPLVHKFMEHRKEVAKVLFSALGIEFCYSVLFGGRPIAEAYWITTLSVIMVGWIIVGLTNYCQKKLNKVDSFFGDVRTVRSVESLKPQLDTLLKSKHLMGCLDVSREEFYRRIEFLQDEGITRSRLEHAKRVLAGTVNEQEAVDACQNHHIVCMETRAWLDDLVERVSQQHALEEDSKRELATAQIKASALEDIRSYHATKPITDGEYRRAIA